MMRWFVLLLPLAAMTLQAQSANNRPDFTGVWAIYRGQPAPPAAGADAGGRACHRQYPRASRPMKRKAIRTFFMTGLVVSFL